MKRSAVVVILLLVAVFSMGSVAAVKAAEPFSGPVQQLEGQTKAIDFACNAAQGMCEGSMVVKDVSAGFRSLAVMITDAAT
jgi:hypothetical protein